ncbi:hypothetical protein [Bosea sp. Root381]|uniref:hypothetical protein n=1 Tax=Bosea sp. Root381 TaxID=1736524 RepID=UPI0012E37D76|nr:hypothetical protein [Bosea sp. Root381]
MTAAIKRLAAVYGLLALAGLLTIFAAGYALNAGYTMLVFRFGAVIASLIMTGSLVAAAIVCLVASRVIASRPGQTVEKLSTPASPYSAPPLRLSYSRQSTTAAASGIAGVATVIVVLKLFPGLRARLKGKPSISTDDLSRPGF